MKIFTIAVVIATGCVPPPTRHYMPPEQSHTAVKAPPDETARALIALFTHRGFALVDQHPLPRGGLAIKLKGSRTPVTEGGQHWTASSVIGSVFYIDLEQAGASLTQVNLYGKPTLDGVEACEGVHAGEPCVPMHVDGRQLVEMSGREEAETIHGVLSELVVEGLIDQFMPAHE